MEDKLKKEGIENTKDQEKREKKLDGSIKKAKVDPSNVSSLVKTVQRITQRRIEFFRCLRNFLFSTASWGVALDSIQLVYEVFS